MAISQARMRMFGHLDEKARGVVLCVVLCPGASVDGFSVADIEKYDMME